MLSTPLSCASPAASPASATPSWRVGSTPDALRAVRHPARNAAVWERTLPSWVSAGLSEWAQRGSSSFDAVVDVPRVPEGLTRGLSGRLAAWLEADVSSLLALAAELTGARRAKVAWSSEHGERCPKFHVDYVLCRLICTYVGPGTLWLPDDAVDRAALEHALDCPCDSAPPVLSDPARVRQAGPGHVLALKGVHAGSPQGAVHKSPPVAPGDARAVLVITVKEPARSPTTPPPRGP
jgi:hypothetical protein